MVFRRSPPEPVLTREEIDGAIAMLMSIDEGVGRLPALVEEEDDGEQEGEEDG